MFLEYLDYWALTFLDTGHRPFLTPSRAWCDDMIDIFGESCYCTSWKMLLLGLLTFGALNIQHDTLCILFT